MNTFWPAFYYFILATIMALLEIEIEGRSGWAKKLPTWRLTKDNLLLIFTNQRPVTGYWFFVNLLWLFIFHQPLFHQTWNLMMEINILFRWLVFLPIWDFLWFVFNPHFGLKKFKQKKIWWHKKIIWFLGLAPQDYLWAIIIALALPFIVLLFNNATELLSQYLPYLIYLIIQLSLTFFAIIIAPLYHKLYHYLRK